ncbi:hypothetical protein BT93_C2085 [Corymbia citriodora subsp. variegata]|nr:hypothetical protein BT93_C2085 [Corymbia citriodora subsp. variegata]
MKRLRLFRVHNVYHLGDPIYFTAKLRCLVWPNYSLPSMPFNTGQEKLVHLDMSNSSIRELGKGFKLFRNLKSVNFSRCTLLSEIPDVLSLPNLESLDLRQCPNLVKVHQSLGGLAKGSSDHTNFYPRLALPSLTQLFLYGCSLSEVKILKNLDCASSMTRLDLLGNEIVHLPRCIGQFTKLYNLHLEDCKQLWEILALPPSLANLCARGCESLESCPYLSHMSQYDGFKKMEYLNFQFEDCHKLVQDQCSNNCSVLSIEGLLGPYEVQIIHPGSKMPKWFVHQCSNNCTMLSVEEFLEVTEAGISFPGRKVDPQFRKEV